jgi:alpha-beta hydrolase superfamily lysophospholipase
MDISTKNIELQTKDGIIISGIVSDTGNVPPKGIVIVIHGFGEHAGSYKALLPILSEAGYFGIVFDQRGHGKLKSFENRVSAQGIMPSLRCFYDDIDIVVEEARKIAPDVPVFFYAHSMGGNIILNYLLQRDQSKFAAVVTEAAWLGLTLKISPFTLASMKLFSKITPNKVIISKLRSENFSHDQDTIDNLKNDELYHNRISLRMVMGVHKGCSVAIKNASHFKLPILMAVGKHDKAVSNEAIKQFVHAGGDNIILKDYDTHHIIRAEEPGKEFLKDALSFYDKILENKI